MSKLKSCPYCDREAMLCRTGDHKQFFVYKCSWCWMTPVHSDEARLTPWGAKRIWNKRVKEYERKAN